MPGVWRLLDPHRRADADARAQREAREHGLRVGHRVLEPLPVLHEHLRRARHPRARSGDRDRRRDGPTRPRRVGDHRRRRRPVDRWQPPHPRAAPQREPHDPALQQPDLRLDEGPVLADERGRQGHEVDAVRFARLPVQPREPRARRRGRVRRSHPRHGSQAHDGDVPSRARPQGRCVRRDLPELQRLQRRRVRDDPVARGPLVDAHQPRAR